MQSPDVELLQPEDLYSAIERKLEFDRMILTIFGIAVAAFCVWLGLRIYNRREKWAKRTAIVIVLMLAYPLSIGPACWLDSRGWLPAWALTGCRVFYAPVFRVAERSPGTAVLYLEYTGYWRADLGSQQEQLF
jgi:predicted permease